MQEYGDIDMKDWPEDAENSGEEALSEAHREALEEELEAHRREPWNVMTLEELRKEVMGISKG